MKLQAALVDSWHWILQISSVETSLDEDVDKQSIKNVELNEENIQSIMQIMQIMLIMQISSVKASGFYGVMLYCACRTKRGRWLIDD